MKLDGTETPKPVPFDAHEQIVRGPHEHTKDGYVTTDPVHTFNAKDEPVPLYRYPKAISHDKETGEPVVAKDARHEAELIAAAKKAEAKEK